MTGGTCGHVGGVEWQTSLTARWLAARGYPVSIVTWQEGSARDEMIDGVRIIKLCAQDAGMRGVRFFHPRWTSLNRAMMRADAQVYYQNCGEYVTGQVAMWCRRHGRGFVYSVASDPDCDPRLPAMRTVRERWLYRYGLRHADTVIVQTQSQQASLQEGFGRDSVVIPMPCAGPGEDAYVAPSFPENESARVAWVGRIVPLKRLEWLVDLAQRLPDVQFDVAGAPESNTPTATEPLERARSLPNVTLLGRVERRDMAGIYKRATVLCCTSEYEGFPNTFLEAWSHGVPVVSTVDPDGLIVSRGLGGVGHDVGTLAAALRGLLESPVRWGEASANARRYYLGQHSVDAALPRFEAVFCRVCGLPA